MASTLELLMLARMLSQPVARAYATTAQSGFTSTPSQVTLGATSFDSAGGFNASGTYTVQVAGTYRVYGKAKLANTATNWVQLHIFKNGVNICVGPTAANLTTEGAGIDVEDLIQCNVGDTIALYLATQTTLATSIADGTGLDVYMNVQLEAWA